MKASQFRAVLCTTAAGFGMWGGTASAQSGTVSAESAAGTGQLEEVVVTAQKRAENNQKVPVAVTAFDASALEAANINTAEDLAQLTPGLVMSRGERTLTPYLRGVGSDVNTVGFESSVAVYVDGVYFTRLSPGFLGLSDVERVEVLKGPQGTLFGRNASAGLINVITVDPSLNETTGELTLGYGNYERSTAEGRVSAPLGDKVAASLAFSYGHQGEGYGVNKVTGNKDFFESGYTLRGKLLFQPSDATRILLTGYYMDSDFGDKGNTYPGTTQGYETPPFAGFPPLGNFYDHRADKDGRSESQAYGGSLKIEQDVGFATLSSITAYQHVLENQSFDADYLDRPEFVVEASVPQYTITQELQLASPSGDSFQWTTGLFYFQNHGEYPPIAFHGLAFPVDEVRLYGEQTAKSYAAYAQGTFKLTDQLSATLGARYTYDDIAAKGHTVLNIGGNLVDLGGPPDDSTTGSRNTFRAALDYQITPDAMVYASFNSGYKAGTYSILPYSPEPAKPELLDAYEVGVKTEFFDRKVRLNGAVFYYDIKDPQILIIAGNAATVANAESADVKGAELDLEMAVTPELTLRLAGSYVDAKYTKFTNAPALYPNPNTDPAFPIGGTLPPTSIDASDTQMIRAPKVQYTASAHYAVETGVGTLSLNADYAYMGDFFWHPDHVLEQDAYGLLGARAALSLSNNIDISIWGRNLTDEKYVNFVIEQAGPAGYPYTAGPPRTYGATIGYRF
jgi:iron complex outermembrane receptor protein